MKYILWFNQVSMRDVPLVGGKNASLGEMITQLTNKGITIPNGFAVTAQAYWSFIKHNNLADDIQAALNTVAKEDFTTVRQAGNKIRQLILQGETPKEIEQEIIQAYNDLSTGYNQKDLDVAIRSSATAEDLPTASFAGQQDTFLNVCGADRVVQTYKKCLASLFTDRAIIYREEKGFEHMKVALSVGIQKMVRSDSASAGVIFSLDTETGFKDVVIIDSSWGLGEAVVKGLITPDEFRIHKPTLKEGFASIIKKMFGDKTTKMIYAEGAEETVEVSTTSEEYNSFSLTDDEILTLARYTVIIEEHFSEEHGRWMPVDIEWAKDGADKKLYIVQARPETVHGQKKESAVIQHYSLVGEDERSLQEALLVKGQSIGRQIAQGKARVAQTLAELQEFHEGDVLITTMTDPDWVPIMKKAAAIITDRGGRTSHAAIVSRELGVPALIATGNATNVIKNGQEITVDCSRGSVGYVYKGFYDIKVTDIAIGKLPKPPVSIMLNTADPDQVFNLATLPVDGVGLARLEFIISTLIQMHPMAAAMPEIINDADIKKKLDELVRGYSDYRTFFVNVLAYSIGAIAAAFYPKPILVRFSDFKSNEYRNLIAGSYYEPHDEANPMLGLRGASRYYNSMYEPAFRLECQAFKKAREDMGFFNIKAMVPFVRTPEELQKVLVLMKEEGLEKGLNDLQVYMMCEVPSNVLLIDQFCQYIDGISIGSNDLTQLTLAVDRDEALLADLFNERNEAVKLFMKQAIEGARKNKRDTSICGQAPSDFFDLATFLIDAGIHSISLNSDAVVPFLESYKS